MIKNKLLSCILILGWLFTGTACDVDAAALLSTSGALELIKPVVDLKVSERLVGSGKVVTENRALTDITSVEHAGIGTVNIIQGKEEGMEIQADENLIQHFNIEVNSGKLTIGVNPGYYLVPKKPVVFTVRVKKLDSVTLTGTGKINVAPFSSKTPFSVVLDGTGSINLEKVKVSTFKSDLKGTGSITVTEGKADIQESVISGAGTYSSAALESLNVKVTISGSGSALVKANEKLYAIITGSGSVTYIGGPVVDSQISGTGMVVKQSEAAQKEKTNKKK